jgi:hypothetical protein
MIDLSRQDAQRAANLARDLSDLLARPALPVLADGTGMMNVQAWRDEGVPEILRTLQARIEQVLTRLQ